MLLVFSAVGTDWNITLFTVHFNNLVRMFGTVFMSRDIVKLPSINCHVVIPYVQYINVHLFTKSTEFTFTVMTVILRGPQTEAAVFNVDLGTDSLKLHGGV